MRQLSIVLLVLLTLTSCEDYLTKSPVLEENEDTFYKDYDDMYAALIAVYEPLQRNWGGGAYMAMDIASDDAYAGGGSSTDGVEGHRTDRGVSKVDDGTWSDLWANNYVGIYTANIFLEKVGGAVLTDEQRTQMTAEVHFLRAYYYLDLVRLFENIPLITKTLDTDEYSQTQNHPDEVYAQIVADLTLAIEGLEGVTYDDSEAGRVTKYAAEALMARAYLFYTGVYNQDVMADVTKDMAIAYLTDVIENSHHALVSDFASLWGASDNWNAATSKNTVEGVFEVQHSNVNDSYQWWNASYDSGNKMSIFVGPRGTGENTIYYSGWGFEPVTPQLYLAYEEGDSRRNATILDAALEIGNDEHTTDSYQYTGYFNKKMAPIKRDVEGSNQAELSFPYNYTAIRFSDVLLMAAELQVGTATADNYYNQVRGRAFGADYENVSGVTLEDIFDERRLELALEGQRYWDLLRQGATVVEEAIAVTSGALPFNSGFNTASKGFWPIPSTEIALSGYALKQNAGY